MIVGEVHDNPEHHINQATAVAVLRPAALVFEMLEPSAALRVTPDIRNDAAEMARVLEWEASGWPDFAMYHPIFLAAPDAVIFGGAVSREEARRAVTDGAAEVFGSAAPLFGLDTPLPDQEREDREAGQMAAHCDALPEDILPGMVEAQRLRDAALARAIVAAMAETEGPVVVITGNGHARTDWGIPRALDFALPDVSVISIGQLEAPPEGEQPYDAWLVTDPAERDDPCAAFRE